MKPFAAATAVLLAATVLAGCSDLFDDKPSSYEEMGFEGKDATGRNRAFWPDLHGAKVTILDQGAFQWVFDAAKPLFEELTNGTVERIDGGDAYSALGRAIEEKEDPPADVIYGIDNAAFARAVEGGVLLPYTPVLADRVRDDLLFFQPPEAEGGDEGEDGDPWPATPVDHGYVAVNVDPAHFWDGGVPGTLHLVRDNADEFVTMDPNQSSPGLGFLLATIETFGEDPSRYDWKDYWSDLLEGGALVTPDWGTGYEQHFSAGYGASYGAADRHMVTSYTTSPAYEVYSGNFPPEGAAHLVVEPGSVFHQVETMAILKGTKERAAAQAWIEFTLTDAYQELMAPYNAVYPVVAGVGTGDVYGDVAPDPEGLEPVAFAHTGRPLTEHVGANLERWLEEWDAICEAHDCL